MKTRKEGDCCVSPVGKKLGRNGGERSFYTMGKKQFRRSE